MIQNIEELLDEANLLVAKARTYGFDLTIRQESLPPFAMGNHVAVVSVAPRNELYRKAPSLPEAIQEVI